jgi:hypothetical protein
MSMSAHPYGTHARNKFHTKNRYRTDPVNPNRVTRNPSDSIEHMASG